MSFSKCVSVISRVKVKNSSPGVTHESGGRRDKVLRENEIKERQQERREMTQTYSLQVTAVAQFNEVMAER